MNAAGFRVALRFVRGHYARTALTVVAVALGVALICALDLVTRSTEVAFGEVIDAMAGRAALEIRSGEGGLVPEELAADIAKVPGVELAVPVVQASAFTTDGVREAVTVQGVDVLNEDALRTYEARDESGALLEDPISFLADPRSIVLTKTFAARRGLAEGDRLELDTPRGKRTFSILRLLEPQGVARVYGGNLVVMDVAAAEDVFTERGLVHRVDVVVARDAQLAAVRSAIESRLPAGLHVTTPAQRKVDLQNVMASFGLLLRALGLVGLVIAFLIAFNGVSSVFERRAWQLGVLATIGARPRTIWWIQMREAIVLGVAGVALGLPLGIALAHLVLPFVATATALNFKLVAPEARLVPDAVSVVMAVSLGIAVTMLAAWLPAARAVRLGIASSLRGKGQETVQSRTPLRWALPAAAWTTVAIAVVVEAVTRSATFGLGATALVAIATATSAPPLVQLAARGILPLLVRVAGASGRLAAAGLRDHPRRVGLTTAMIGVGVGTVAWLAVLAESFQGSVVDALGRAIRADLVVTSTNVGSGFLEAPLDAEVLSAVREVPGIAAAAGWRALEWPYDGASVGLSAYDPEYFRDTRFGEWPLEAAAADDAWDLVARGVGVVVSTSFVASFGTGVGEQLVLETPTGMLSLPIVGVTVDFVAPKGTIEMSRAVFAARWRDASVTRIFALREPTASADDLRQAITRRLGDRFELRILSARELLDYFVVQVRRAFSVLPIVAAVVFLVILVGLADSLATTVLERRRELAIVGAIGLRPRLVRRVLLLEGLVVGAVGLALATAAALLLATLWVGRTFQLLLGWSLDLSVPASSVAILAVVTLVICYVASRIPAMRAERLAIAEALRSE